MNLLSERIKRVKPSATMAITQRAKELKNEGRDVIALSAGEPDFDAPPSARKEAIKAIEEGFTHYTMVPGILPLREAICEYLKKDFSLEYFPEDIVVGCGAKSVLFHLFQVLVNPAEEVIIPSPYWVSYPEQVRLAGGVPVILETKEHEAFVPKPAELRKLLNEKTRILILNVPSNPCGAVLEPCQFKAIAEVLREFPEVTVITDEIYAQIVYDGFRQESFVKVAPEFKERTVVVNGMSKVYAMTGWRVGFAAGPEGIIKALRKIQGQSTSNASSIAQRAALGALRGDQRVVSEMISEFSRRRDRMMDLLKTLPEVRCFKPRGAFYCFPNVSAYFSKKTPSGIIVRNSVELASFLLEEMQVALVPGMPFGAPRHMRLSFATSLNQMEEGVSRMKRGLEKLK